MEGTTPTSRAGQGTQLAGKAGQGKGETVLELSENGWFEQKMRSTLKWSHDSSTKYIVKSPLVAQNHIKAQIPTLYRSNLQE
ncbi:hypothetical protein TIFTF001_015464 [Ficus carica]|uniref:Uncharacterized protein n=1 Tax=Ficus carica TaxID=3494 RepID=A0AA88A786_FICCA|nr:hypothetical protein TIFTF001_015464 [Ficus carica]